MGALSFACLEAKKGRSVLVLERVAEPGGCASSYSKKGIRFEAGATTIVGMDSGLPLDRLFQILGIPREKLSIKHLDPSQTIHFPEEDPIFRFQDREKWIQVASSRFGEESSQKRFWRLLFWLSDRVWDLSRRYYAFPPHSIRDWIRLLRNFRFSDIIVFLGSLVSLGIFWHIPGFPKSQTFRRFLDEQLMITLQTKVAGAPISQAAAGITYPNLKNIYWNGGVGSLAGLLVNFLQEKNQSVRFREEVVSIQKGKDENTFLIITKKGKYRSRQVGNGIPIWNWEKMITGNISKKLDREIQKRITRFSRGIWGAFQLGIWINDFLDPNSSLHHQFHIPGGLPEGGGESFFVSISDTEDKDRAPLGTRVLSISTHIKDPESWDRKSREYQVRKLQITEAILSHLEKHWLGFDRKNILEIQSASPGTWEVWSGRKWGRVGGIPADQISTPFSYPSPIFSEPGIYGLGDTFYPGQGIPGVVLGALNLSERLKNSK